MSGDIPFKKRTLSYLHFPHYEPFTRSRDQIAIYDHNQIIYSSVIMHVIYANRHLWRSTIVQRVPLTISHNALSSFGLQSRPHLHDHTILLVLLFLLLPFVRFGSTLCSGVHPDLPPPFVLIMLPGRIAIFLVLKRRRQLSVRTVVHYPILPSSVD
jgi:hypothetical protein